MSEPIETEGASRAHFLCRERFKPIQSRRVDWFQVLMDLKRAGLSMSAVAIMIQANKSTVIGWKNLDAEPKHIDGERLVMLWCRATGQGREAIPVEAEVGKRPDRRVHPVPALCPCCEEHYTPRIKRAALDASGEAAT